MKHLSIRVRLTGWYSAVLLLGLTLFGFAMWFALNQRLIAGDDARLWLRVQGLSAMLQEQGANRDAAHVKQEFSEFAGQVPETVFQLRDESGETILPRKNQQAFPWNAAGAGPSYNTASYRTVDRDGRHFRVVTAHTMSGGRAYSVLAANSLDDVEAVMRDFRDLLFVTIPAVLALACLGGYWLSLRALRPVDAITSVAKSISVHNLSQRVEAPRTGDELQRMAETWNDVLQRLEVAVKSIRQFTADASHEVRTPLALIRATAELALRRERTPEEYRASLRSIESEAKRMTALTESLLTLARADAKGFEMPLAPVDLNALAGSVVRQNAARAADRRVSMHAKTNGRAAVVHANEAGLERLLLILIDNALKHTPEGGSVVVSVEHREGGDVLAVEDTGEGIAPEDLLHIFERFYRSDPARGGGSGFGLGLSIAQTIAQAHGSQITVESSPGAGARFALLLKD